MHRMAQFDTDTFLDQVTTRSPYSWFLSSPANQRDMIHSECRTSYGLKEIISFLEVSLRDLALNVLTE